MAGVVRQGWQPMMVRALGGRPRRRARRLPLAVFAACAAACSPQYTDVRPTMMPWDAPLPAFWQRTEIPDQNLFDGPWGAAQAPDPLAEYTVLARKADETPPRLTVEDASGRRWDVSQLSHARHGRGSIEVVLSRVLSALGYRQPPVYFLPSFTLRDQAGVHNERGGRFRREGGPIEPHGTWSWERNPFVGMRPYQGLLIVLLMFNATNLDSSSTALCDVVRGDAAAQWYVVHDLAAALGPAGLAAGRDPDAFARNGFIVGLARGFAEFDYTGSHQALVRDRITADDVGWASFLLSGLSERQWDDAFRAAGYHPSAAARFIATLRARIAQGRRIGGDDWP